MDARRGKRHHRAFRAAALLASAAPLLAACSGIGPDAAAWRLAPDKPITPDTTTFTALVTRIGCNNGVTGDVHEPEIRLEDDEVVVTFTVASVRGEASCPGNDEVAYEVELAEPLGGRTLVDGQCTSDEARGTSFCRPDGVRYSPS